MLPKSRRARYKNRKDSLLVGFMFGEKEIADAFDVSPRTLRRWLKRSEITLPLIREQIILPREHLYFLWLRLCRDRRHRYHAIAMANAGHAMWKYLNRVRMEND